MKNGNHCIDKHNYITEMRKRFTNKEILTPDGEINHRYFHCKFGHYWTEENYILLIKGIQDLGLGALSEIKSKYLKNWTETEIKLRTSILLGRNKWDDLLGRRLSEENLREIWEESKRDSKRYAPFKNISYFK